MIHLEELHKDIEGGIAVIDFGGQYAHLIASKIRRLGCYSEILLPEEFLKKNIDFYKGIVLSGGPESVYEESSPKISKEIFNLNLPILGICYGHQYIVHTLGGVVQKSETREYGPAELILKKESLIVKNLKNPSVVWMSHGDEVKSLPAGFKDVGFTKNCKFAVVENSEKKIFGLQFHPEVYHTEEGTKILNNFIEICNLKGSWNLQRYLDNLIKYLKIHLKDKKVFFLVSGGVDSTVAFTLLGKVLDSEHLFGVLVDTGFLRYNEAKRIQESLKEIGIFIHIEDAKEIFFNALKNILDPEKKRKLIGELFLQVQKSLIEKLNLDSSEWILGMGTIYPDTIESGSTKHSHKIKTHHNRIPIIGEMISKKLVVEPLKDLYKDEVREIGKLLGLPKEILYKHPFPGPGLAIRCLCNENSKSIENLKISFAPFASFLEKSFIQVYRLPLFSVGVQGDQRSYANTAGIFFKNQDAFKNNFDWDNLLNFAKEVINHYKNINRVILYLNTQKENQFELKLKRSYLTEDRIKILQIVDEIVYRFLIEKELYYQIWQFPVILAPLTDSTDKESIILRPILSTDAMTAAVYQMDLRDLLELSERIYNTNLISFVFYDLTTKPPATIEWE
ncbi:MAG: glutamine-hydrolyzing GMP synthase [Leptonema sp. (in: bacteria)]